MLSQKVDEKKKMTYLIVLAVIVVVVAVLLYKNFIGNKGGGQIGIAVDESILDISEQTLLRNGVKSLNADFLKGEIFNNLVDTSVEPRTIESLSVGNSKPFAEDKAEKKVK